MAKGWVELDGSASGSGSHMLRLALALSLMTGKRFRVGGLRAARPACGLALRDLAALRACAAIGEGRVTDAALGSDSVSFTPGRVQPGNYRFDLGDACAAPLLSQTLFWPLALQSAPSTVTLLGVTHDPAAPTFETLSMCWAPLLRRLGVGVELRMPRAGFLPEGGGELRLTVRGRAAPHGVRWGAPVVFDAFTGMSLQAGLGEEIAERQAAGARAVLEAAGIYCPMQAVRLESSTAGVAIVLVAGSRWAPIGSTAIGKPGKDAEQVGREAAEALVRLVQARAPVDPWGAEHLLIPLALAPEPSRFLTSWPTDTLRTAARVVEHFLPVRIAIEDEQRGCAMVQVEPLAGG